MSARAIEEMGPGVGEAAAARSDEQRIFALLDDLPASDSRRERLRAEIAGRYLGLVESLAARYRGRGEPFEDIVQAGNVGLVKAIDGFDPARGKSFVTYASCTIVGEIKRHFRDTTWAVHVPRRLQELRVHIRAAARELTAAGIAEPTSGDLAAHLGMDEEEVRQAGTASNAYSSLSLDAPTAGDGSTVLADTLGSDDAGLDLVVDLQALRELLGRLPEREKTILLLRFYGNKTQSEIADEVGLSQMHVSRLLNQTLKSLRRALTTDEEPRASAPPRDTDEIPRTAGNVELLEKLPIEPAAPSSSSSSSPSRRPPHRRLSGQPRTRKPGLRRRIRSRRPETGDPERHARAKRAAAAPRIRAKWIRSRWLNTVIAAQRRRNSPFCPVGLDKARDISIAAARGPPAMPYGSGSFVSSVRSSRMIT